MTLFSSNNPTLEQQAGVVERQVTAAFQEIVSHGGMPLSCPAIDALELANVASLYKELAGASVLLMDDQPAVLRATLPTLVAVTNGNAKGVLHMGKSAVDSADQIAEWVLANGYRPALVVLDGSLANRVTGFEIARSLIERDLVSPGRIVVSTGGAGDEAYQLAARELHIAICGKDIKALLPLLWERAAADSR